MPLYEEIEIEDMTYDPNTLMYTYPCPCGDKFKIYLEDLWDGEDIADCQSCTLFIQVIYEEENLPQLPSDNDDDSDNDNTNNNNIKEEEKNTTSNETIQQQKQENNNTTDDDLNDKVAVLSI